MKVNKDSISNNNAVVFALKDKEQIKPERRYKLLFPILFICAVILCAALLYYSIEKEEYKGYQNYPKIPDYTVVTGMEKAKGVFGVKGVYFYESTDSSITEYQTALKTAGYKIQHTEYSDATAFRRTIEHWVRYDTDIIIEVAYDTYDSKDLILTIGKYKGEIVWAGFSCRKCS